MIMIMTGPQQYAEIMKQFSPVHSTCPGLGVLITMLATNDNPSPTTHPDLRPQEA